MLVLYLSICSTNLSNFVKNGIVKGGFQIALHQVPLFQVHKLKVIKFLREVHGQLHHHQLDGEFSDGLLHVHT